jgi:hypothetical protein
MSEPTAGDSAGAVWILLGEILATMRRKGTLDDAEVARWRDTFAADAVSTPGRAVVCNNMLSEAITRGDQS